VIRRQLLDLLRAHGEEEIHRGSPVTAAGARIAIAVEPGAAS